MIFNETKLKGAFTIEPEKITDERGFFTRVFDDKIFKNYGLKSSVKQCNVSFNQKKGTLRGLHYQNSPYEEAKLVRCTQGSVFEVMVDMRPTSSTYLQWEGIELSDENRLLLYAPEGFALGFQTLGDNTELFYQMFEKFVPDSGNGIIWNDPTLNIIWPMEPTVISKKDLSLPLLRHS